MTDSQRIQNFAAVARLLQLARRRKLCAWTMAFRAGATHNALTELNHSGAITLAQYKCLDAWIFWGAEAEKERMRASRGHTRPAAAAPAVKVKPVKKAKPKPKLAARTFKASRKFKRRRSA